MGRGFTIEEATAEDIPAIMKILTPSFANIPVEALLGNHDTPEGRKAAGERHLQAWREHARDNTTPCAIKCVHTDPSTGGQTIVGFAEWFIYEHPFTQSPTSLLSASWVPNDEQRATAQRWLKPMLDKRLKWLKGRPCAVLMYMCVDPVWRRRGASTLCVKWGLERCGMLGVPAYLCASEEGKPVYESLGYEVVDQVATDVDGVKTVYPVMMWWPPGTEEQDKRPIE